ncbi:MAG: type IV pilus biogenesis protein PilP [Rickettsiales bacterium]|jgi:type IV pilus biogenesis protein PilP|nr:type IV pilus biogenesis protein PilP [Rickettsiales bacterium]
MPNKKQNTKSKIQMMAMIAALAVFPAIAADENVDFEQISADAITEYDVDGSIFQQITDLEQEKILMQLEKERAQLDLELDRLAAEKIKLHLDIDTLSGRAEEQQQALETEKAKLEAEAERLKKEKQSIAAQAESAASKPVFQESDEVQDGPIEKKYRLIDIVGVGKQLQATVESVDSGQNKKVSVGKTLDGYTVKSISLDEGVVFSKDGISETLNIRKDK